MHLSNTLSLSAIENEKAWSTKNDGLNASRERTVDGSAAKHELCATVKCRLARWMVTHAQQKCGCSTVMGVGRTAMREVTITNPRFAMRPIEMSLRQLNPSYGRWNNRLLRGKTTTLVDYRRATRLYRRRR